MGDLTTLAKARRELEDLYSGIPDDSVNLTFQHLAQLEPNSNSSSSSSSSSSSKLERKKSAAALMNPPPISDVHQVINAPTSAPHLTKLPSLDFNTAFESSNNHHNNLHRDHHQYNNHHHHTNNHYAQHNNRDMIANNHHDSSSSRNIHPQDQALHASHDRRPYGLGENSYGTTHANTHGHNMTHHDDHQHHGNGHNIAHHGSGHNMSTHHLDRQHHASGHHHHGPAGRGHGHDQHQLSGFNNSMGFDDMSATSIGTSMNSFQAGRRRPGVPHSNICTICSVYIYMFRHRCLVCGRVYCRQCASIGMGEMTEGRKCIDCLGKRFSQRYIQRAGKMGCWSGCCMGYPSSAKQQELKWAEKGPRRSGYGGGGRSGTVSSRSRSPMTGPNHHIPGTPPSFVASSPAYSPYSPSPTTYHLPL